LSTSGGGTIGQIVRHKEAKLRPVSIIGTGQIPVQKKAPQTLRQMGATVIRQAMASANVSRVDALYASNMLGDELQGQKHLAALLADEAGLSGVEALEIRAATAAGAAALRVAYLAVASGAAEFAIAVGVEKMSQGIPTPILAKALDARYELPDGATLLSQNAYLMQQYKDTYHPPEDAFAHFSVNAHRNAHHNPNALFQNKPFTTQDVLDSRLISPPMRLLDCSPICDGAAAVLLAPTNEAHHFNQTPVRILASNVVTDRFRSAERKNPLAVEAMRNSAEMAFSQAGLTREGIDFFEVHDAFSIMACLALEAAGFARWGEGWRLGEEGEIGLKGRIPISTMGGLKARGHPIGATAIYQVCEIVQQLTGTAGPNQLASPEIALMQSVGGVATTIITHMFGI
jgi:acetyl-CoA C-acetyltransferase